MTRKHFEAIAKEIAQTRAGEIEHGAVNDALDELTSRLATTFAGFNPNFDRARFVQAAGRRNA